MVARRISFSVCAFCRASFRRSLSDCSECALFSSSDSLFSRSRTWRSLRSRNARWLCTNQQMSGHARYRIPTLPCSALSAGSEQACGFLPRRCYCASCLWHRPCLLPVPSRHFPHAQALLLRVDRGIRGAMWAGCCKQRHHMYLGTRQSQASPVPSTSVGVATSQSGCGVSNEHRGIRGSTYGRMHGLWLHLLVYIWGRAHTHELVVGPLGSSPEICVVHVGCSM